MFSRIRTCLTDQRGVSLVEVLATLTIFVLIFIPLTSVYIRGVEVYNQTREATSLRNEADFVIGTVMRTLQEATYFELGSVANVSDRNTLVRIFQSEKAGSIIAPDETSNPFTDRLLLFKQTNAYELADPTKPYDATTNPGFTRSLLTRTQYQFNLPDNPDEITAIDRAFDHNANYLVRGLFRLAEDNRTLTLYLLVVPYGSPVEDPADGQQKQFETLAQVEAELNDIPDGQVSRYIRAVRTDLTVNNLRRGE